MTDLCLVASIAKTVSRKSIFTFTVQGLAHSPPPKSTDTRSASRRLMVCLLFGDTAKQIEFLIKLSYFPCNPGEKGKNSMLCTLGNGQNLAVNGKLITPTPLLVCTVLFSDLLCMG